MDETEDSTRGRRGGVQSVEVAGLLLEAVVTAGAPLPLADIARHAQMAPAKAHRYITSLCEIGLAMQHESGRYGLGPLALRMGLSAIAQHDVLERGHEVLVRLCDELRVSGHLSVWSEAGPVVIRSAHGGPPVISPVAVGTILPLLRSASGLVYLAFMGEHSTTEARRNQATAIDPPEAQVRAEVARTRETGLAFADGQYVPGLCALALPILNHDRSLAGAATFVSTDASVFALESAPTKTVQSAFATLQADWSLPEAAV